MSHAAREPGRRNIIPVGAISAGEAKLVCLYEREFTVCTCLP